MDRESLIEELAGEVADRRVLDAIATVPRDLFVPEAEREAAWENRPLPIGEGQTISQPLVVASMCELLALRPGDLVLDVGGGSGYHAAVMARLVSRVVSLELHPALADSARYALAAAGVENVEMIAADASQGWPEKAPYDRINVAAAARDRAPEALLRQLAEGGRMVVPVGRSHQRLELWHRNQDAFSRKEHMPVAFVPLVEGEE